MSRTLGNTPWGSKNGARSRRLLAVVAAALAVLVAPAVARAGDIPAPLLDQAQADPSRVFDVIVQTKDGGKSAAETTASAITDQQRKALNDAVKKANDATKKATDLARRAADAAARAAEAQQVADALAAQAGGSVTQGDLGQLVGPVADLASTLSCPGSVQPTATVTQPVADQLSALTASVAALGLDPGLSRDLLHRLDDIGHRLEKPDGGDACSKIDDLAKKIEDGAAGAGGSTAQDAAAKAQEQAAQLLADAQDLEEQANAAQAAIIVSQLAIAQAQGQLFVATSQANGDIEHQFNVIPAVSAKLTGTDLVALAQDDNVVGVVPDTYVHSTESNSQKWVDAVDAHWYWRSHERKNSAGLAPTIAIVDSGVDSSRVADFGGRVLTQVDLTSGTGPNSPGDGRGHGTMVASLAAGDGEHRAGVDPDARLVSLDVIDDNGQGRTSDVIAAIDWILQNRYVYNIRVANFSLQAGGQSSFMFDPLSLAVERLWLNGIVVVAAAGNYASGGAVSGVLYAPASDPFVITVGAVDTGGNHNVKDDVAAPWSSWGYTPDGFLKPEISAPGRYMIGAAPQNSTLARGGGQDARLVSSGYLQLSGTSFAAPIVSGVVAALLSVHPEWTPDQVKGALMVSASELRDATFGSAGVGEVDLRSALKVTSPPNPNAALDAFLVSTPTGVAFDVPTWASTAQSNASWSSASWSSASWSSASWSSASWTSAAWTSAAWTSASWSSASWSSASWSSAIQGLAVAPADNASADGYGEG